MGSFFFLTIKNIPLTLFLRQHSTVVGWSGKEAIVMEETFATGSVPVSIVARVYGKDASWVRAGIISGWLPIGKATRNGQLVTSIDAINSKYGRINFYISPKLLYEETGYMWRGERNYNAY